MITGKLYDWLKFVAQIVLPALGTLYFVLAGIWGLPSAEQVVGTIVAVDTFLGALLGISQLNYNKQIADGGVLKVGADGDPSQFRLELDEHPEDLAEKKEVHFKVVKAAKQKPAAKRRKR